MEALHPNCFKAVGWDVLTDAATTDAPVITSAIQFLGSALVATGAATSAGAASAAAAESDARRKDGWTDGRSAGDGREDGRSYKLAICEPEPRAPVKSTAAAALSASAPVFTMSTGAPVFSMPTAAV